MKQWEYAIDSYQLTDKWSSKAQKEEVVKFEATLNWRGSEGWELVGYQSVPIVGGFSGKINSYAYLCIWKREKAA